MEIINVKDLSFSYDDKKLAVDHVSFAIEEGSYTTIIGHNGSGKSTLAKLLIALLEKKSGSITIANLPLDEEHLYDIREKVGVVFQNPDNQFIGSTVADDIAFGLENHQVPSEKMQDLIEEYAQKVGMSDFLNSEPTKLSGGQKQRVAIAGVLAMNLNIIILDEATSMLDPKGKQEINELIQTLHQKTNLTIVFITHDMEEVTKSDYVIVLDDGKVKMQGKPSDVLMNEKALVESKLDIPFALKLQKELAKVGVEVDKQITIEGIVDELCQLHANN
ncbi:MAG: energy-coupling factor transporter ATPase [Erysipelotrichia bacterium]|nr:energy-coupling factor transporter ATPase [Erysipelotrichia bacterium]NCC54682.1 energy-coupling factor transporter ATPase [Erysipelotrichia bacterium]